MRILAVAALVGTLLVLACASSEEELEVWSIGGECSYSEGEFVLINLSEDVSPQHALTLFATAISVEQSRRGGIRVRRGQIDSLMTALAESEEEGIQ